MIEIRPLAKSDNLDDLIELSQAFFEEYEPFHADFFKIDQLRDDDVISYFNKWIEHPDGETFIAFDSNKIVAYITVYVSSQPGYWKVKQVGNISGLMVQKDYRRKGIARRLLEQSVIFFKQKDVRYFTVYTSSENYIALRFYKKHGLNVLHTTMLGDVNKSID